MFPTAAPNSHRCFRTTADGRIPLAPDWPALFAAMRLFAEVSLLTRHATARFVHLGPAPRLGWNASRTAAISADGALVLHTARWSQSTAWGRIDACECCGSPGRIELHQPGEIEFLQLSAATDCSATTWADCLASLVSDTWIPGPNTGTTPAATPLPAAPDHACPLAVGGEALGALLAALGEQDVPVACTLRTAETKHTRSFVPQRVVIDDGVLTTTDLRTTLQLVLPAVASLAVTLDGTDHSLHVVAPTGELLATFHAAPGANHAAVWQAALAAAFPRLR